MAHNLYDYPVDIGDSIKVCLDGSADAACKIHGAWHGFGFAAGRVWPDDHMDFGSASASVADISSEEAEAEARKLVASHGGTMPDWSNINWRAVLKFALEQLIKFLVVLAMIFGWASKSHAGAYDAEAAAALEMALISQVPAHLPARKPSYADLYAQAVKESRPLVVWVGYRCPSSASQVPGMLHHHAADDPWHYDGDPPRKSADGPAVLVLVPRDGSLWRAATISAEDCCAASIRRAVETQIKTWESEASEEQEGRSSSGWSSQPMMGSSWGSGAKGMMRQAPMMRRASPFTHLRSWARSRDGSCSS